jgi:hypothetical protein
VFADGHWLVMIRKRPIVILSEAKNLGGYTKGEILPFASLEDGLAYAPQTCP